MRKVLFVLLLTSCGLPPHAAADEDQGYCSQDYPFEQSPDLCESHSYGDCCTWTEVETDEGTCRFDYCSFYGDGGCNWELQLKECE
jgi:hypothetical protein